jgi:hypothetical protein
MSNVARVISLADRRQRNAALAPTAARGHLYVQIHDDGRVDYDMGHVDIADAPAMMMACMIMMMRLTKTLDGDVCDV